MWVCVCVRALFHSLFFSAFKLFSLSVATLFVIWINSLWMCCNSSPIYMRISAIIIRSFHQTEEILHLFLGWFSPSLSPSRSSPPTAKWYIHVKSYSLHCESKRPIKIKFKWKFMLNLNFNASHISWTAVKSNRKLSEQSLSLSAPFIIAYQKQWRQLMNAPTHQYPSFVKMCRS